MSNQQRDPQTYDIIGACMEVHNQLGHGFLEPVYQEAVEIEFRHRNLPHEREKVLTIRYRGIQLEPTYKAEDVHIWKFKTDTGPNRAR